MQRKHRPALCRKLDENRRLLALGFMALTALVVLPVCMISRDDLLIPLLLCVLAVHIVLALILYHRGLAAMAKWAVWYLGMAAIIAISVALSRKIELPGFLDEGVFSSLSIAFFLALMQGFQLPDRVERRVRARMDGSEAQLVARPQRIEWEEPDALMKILWPSWATWALPARKRKQRMFSGAALAVVGVVGLMIFSNAHDESSTMLGSWVFWGAMACLTLMVSGGALCLVGPKRALPLLSVWAAALALALACGYGIDTLLRLNMALGIGLIALLIGLVTVVTLWLRYRRLTGFAANFARCQRDGHLYGLNWWQMRALPVAGFAQLREMEMQLKPNATGMNAVHAKTYRTCQKCEVIFAGYDLDPATMTDRILLYGRESVSLDRACASIAARHCISARHDREDIAWGAYQDLMNRMHLVDGATGDESDEPR